MTVGAILDALKSVSLRPTTIRIAVMQVLSEHDGEALGVEDIYRAMAVNGVLAGIGTIYRTTRELDERGLVLREWNEIHKAMYRLKPAGYDDDWSLVRLVCRDSGRVVLLDDAGLHSCVMEAARAAGFDLTSQVLRIEVDSLRAAKARGTGSLSLVNDAGSAAGGQGQGKAVRRGRASL